MKVAVSTIAWEPRDDAAVVARLAMNGISGIELTPTKWRDDPYAAPLADVDALRAKWNAAGLEIVAMQSLLFGRADLALFGDPAARAALGGYLRQAIDFANRLGAFALVFGSPRNRARGPTPPREALSIAAEFFRDLGEYASSRDCAICIEANPPAYGCDFITTTREAIALCERVDSPGFRLNLDVGTMALNDEDPASTIGDAARWIGHVHASAPQLAEIAADRFQIETAAALHAVGYAGWVSVEMRPPSEETIAAVDRASALARRLYG